MPVRILSAFLLTTLVAADALGEPGGATAVTCAVDIAEPGRYTLEPGFSCVLAAGQAAITISSSDVHLAGAHRGFS